MVDKRMFEFVEGSSNKFWEVWSEGSEVRTRYGKIGSAGQVTVKDEGSSEQAEDLYLKMIKEKTKKGYIEIGSTTTQSTPAQSTTEQATAKATGAVPTAKATKKTKATAKKGGATSRKKAPLSREPELPVVSDAEVAAVAAAVGLRPVAAPHWGYEFVVDAHASDRVDLVSFLSQATRLKEELGMADYFVVGADTPSELQHSAWGESCILVHTEQLRAHLPPQDNDARLLRLRSLLATPQSKAWAELQMLLSSWPSASLAEALALAAAGLASWPDELKSPRAKMQPNPAVASLNRAWWGSIKEGRESGALATSTVVTTDDFEGLLQHHRELGHVRQLSLHGRADAADVVVQCVGLTGLEVLILSSNHGPAALDVGALLAAPHLRGLRGLSTSGLSLSATAVGELAAADQGFDHLRIQRANMKGKATGAALARLTKKNPLRTLDVKYNALGPAGAKALFEGGDWSALRVLDISANEVGDGGVAALTSAALPELRWLNLASNANKEQLTEASGQALGAARALGKLETLIVNGHSLGSQGLGALLSSSSLSGLRGLGAYGVGSSLPDLLEACGGDGPALRLVDISGQAHGPSADWSRATFLRQVTNLKIEDLDGKDYAGLLACAHLDRLEVLTLGGCYSNVGSAFTALIEATPPPALRTLNLAGWKLTEEQARAFVTSPLGRQLHGLDLMTSYTPSEAWRVFHAAGLPLINHVSYDNSPTSEFFTDTVFRQEL